MIFSIGASAGAALLAVGLALAAAADAVDWTRAMRVDEVTRDDRFVPNHLEFRRGVAYRLHLSNRGKNTHEFHAPQFFASVELRDPGVLNADRTEILLQPGEEKDAYFVPLKTGRFSLICPDHDWDGMTGTIEVK